MSELRTIWVMLRRDPGIVELFITGALVILGRRDIADRRIARREASGG